MFLLTEVKSYLFFGSCVWTQLMTFLGVNTCSYFMYWGLVAKFPFVEFFAKGTQQR